MFHIQEKLRYTYITIYVVCVFVLCMQVLVLAYLLMVKYNNILNTIIKYTKFNRQYNRSVVSVCVCVSVSVYMQVYKSCICTVPYNNAARAIGYIITLSHTMRRMHTNKQTNKRTTHNAYGRVQQNTLCACLLCVCVCLLTPFSSVIYNSIRQIAQRNFIVKLRSRFSNQVHSPRLPITAENKDICVCI